MKQILKNFLAKDEQPKTTLRNWQRYNGLTLKFLSELENSGGMTTRDISDRTGCNPHHACTKLGQMLSEGLVEKVEKWGWKITRDGINCLLITNSNNINNYVTTTTQQQHNMFTTSTQQHHSQFPLENQQQKKEEWIPGCFHLKWCHIKKFSHDKTYNNKTNIHCDGCVWFKSTAWTGTQGSKGSVG